ncbi:MAG: DNA cytosine methyltransferase [Devosiaceae bacterium]|nr:DNA cytosine methyltransferase [Devosiaceae bacterium MH13]
MQELIIDSFAGGGGASVGIEMALGRSPDYAINHDEKALAMHMANHPTTTHLSKNIWQVDPMDVVGRRPVGLLWASPDCKHFSKAKGGRPVKRNVRDLAWTVVLWARRARPRVIILENVEEFRDWGPVSVEGKPCTDRKGETFDKWVSELRRLGYKVQWRELRACDYGAPTIRKRLFVIARRDGQPIVWPKPTHGDPKSDAVKRGDLKPWRTAAEILDWSLPCPSIFDTAEEIMEKYGLRAKRPLADATLRRIARGVVRHCLERRPFLVSVAHGYSGGRREYLIDDPLGTQTGAGNAHALVAPHITKFRAGSTGHAIDDPLATVTANGESKRPGGAVPLGVVAPVLTHGQQGGRNRSVEDPHHTITASQKDTNAVIAPVLTACGGRAAQSAPRGVDRPMGTLTGKPDHVVAAATMVQTGYGERLGQAPRALDVEVPIGTQVAGGAKHGVVAAFLAQHNTGVTGHDARKPMSGITQTGAQQQIVAAHLSWMYTSNARGGEGGLDKPSKTVLAGGQHAALVAAFLDTYYGTEQAPALDDPMPTETTRDRRSLVTVDIDGETFVIADIGMRMLTPRERFRAQGFPDDYEIETGVLPDGSTVRLTQEAQGRCCGNSVCPPLAKALVEANCADMAEQLVAAE